jgi:hypothetical protein
VAAPERHTFDLTPGGLQHHSIDTHSSLVEEGTRNTTATSTSQGPGECRLNLPHVQNSQLGLNEFFPLCVEEYEPLAITSTFDLVSAHVPIHLKQKIWEGKFIEISILLKSTRDLAEGAMSGEIQFKEGKMCIVRQKTTTFFTIEKWTSAIIIFASIVLEKYRTRAQELFKYMRDVRIAAGRSNGCSNTMSSSG